MADFADKKELRSCRHGGVQNAENFVDILNGSHLTQGELQIGNAAAHRLSHRVERPEVQRSTKVSVHGNAWFGEICFCTLSKGRDKFHQTKCTDLPIAVQ